MSGLDQLAYEQGKESRANAGDSTQPLLFQYEDHHADWLTNEAGFSHSHQHGFGLLNAWRLVNAAKVSQVLGSRTPCIERLRKDTGYLNIARHFIGI